MLTVKAALKSEWFDADDVEPKARFKIKGMSGITAHSFVSVTSAQGKYNADNCRELINECLLDWDNVVDENGEKIEFPGSVSAVDMLDMRSISKIVSAVIKMSIVTDIDKKK